MTDVKISDIPPKTILDGTDEFEGQETNAGASYKGEVSRIGAGKQTINLLSIGMTARETDGATPFLGYYVNSDIMIPGFVFDMNVNQAIQIAFPMPKSWDLGTVVAKFYWVSDEFVGSGDVIWGIRAFSVNDDSPIDTSWGNPVTVTDTFTSNKQQHITDESNEITVGFGLVAESMTYWEVYRDAVSDNYTQPVVLQAVKLHYTTNNNTDD